jgi:hypothetical protein
MCVPPSTYRRPLPWVQSRADVPVLRLSGGGRFDRRVRSPVSDHDEPFVPRHADPQASGRATWLHVRLRYVPRLVDARQAAALRADRRAKCQLSRCFEG